MLRLWDADGTPLATLIGHTSFVSGAIQLSSGHILSWSDDNTLRLWDVHGVYIIAFVGHTHWLRGAMQLGDGRILSWGLDKTLRLWDADGTPIDVLEQDYDLGDRQIIVQWAKKYGYTLNDIYPKGKDPLMAGGRVKRTISDLIIYHPQTGETICTFYGDARFSYPIVLNGGRVIAVGDGVGRVLFLRWVGVGE